MQTKTKAILVASLFTIVGFMLNPNAPPGAAVWGAPAHLGHIEPSGAELGLLMLVSLIESIAFGIGCAFITFGWPLVKRAASSPGMAKAAFAAIAWGLVSWVPHSAMHITNEPDAYARLIAIEYMFHVTLVICALVIARFFLGVMTTPEVHRQVETTATPPTASKA